MDPAWLELQIATCAVIRAAAPDLPRLSTVADVERCFAAAGHWLADEGIGAAPLFERRARPGDHPVDRTTRAVEAALGQDPGADPLAQRFEAVRDPRGRQDRGQHLTPPAVVDLTLALAGLPAGRAVLDPTCGTGTFLVRAATWPGLAPETTLWGVDLDPLAVQLARINLRRVAPGRAFVAERDALTLAPGTSLQGRALPTPDVVVGNLPYVRRHRLAHTAERERRVQALVKRWAERDPDLRLSGHADLYALLLFQLAEVLPPGARLSLLTSNAWLDGAYGAALRRLFAHHFALEAVVESRAEPWFAEAAINTVITAGTRIAPPRDGANRPPPAPCRFVSLLAPILFAEDSRARAARLVTELQGPPRASRRFRRWDLAPAVLRCSPDTASWAEHLRAPPVYRDLMGTRSEVLPPLSAWLTIRRGVTTNWNPFFYPPADAGIEGDYLVPVLRSPQAARSIRVRSATLTDRLFVCNLSEPELRARGHRGALAWIARGRGLTNRRGVPLPEALSHRPWYSLQPRRHRLLFTKTVHDTHLHRVLHPAAAIDQRLYGLEPRSGIEVQLAAAALNSVVTALSAEVTGSTSLGEGALDLPVRVVRERLRVPDPRAFDRAAQADILAAFDALAKRPVGSVADEAERPDRRALDTAILRALGLPPERWLDRLYDALVSLVRERLELAACRSRRRQG